MLEIPYHRIVAVVGGHAATRYIMNLNAAALLANAATRVTLGDEVVITYRGPTETVRSISLGGLALNAGDQFLQKLDLALSCAEASSAA